MSLSLTLVFIIVTVLTSFKGWNDNDFQRKWIFNPYSINKYNQYYRFVTSGFIHSGYLHLFFNMFVLYFFGQKVENQLVKEFGIMGWPIFGLFYIAGIIVSDIPTYIKYKDASFYNALGASGGVSAILFSSVIYDPLREIHMLFIPGIPGFIFMILYLIYSYLMSQQSRDNINHDAHLFGAAFGILFTVLISPGAIPNFLEQISRFKMF